MAVKDLFRPTTQTRIEDVTKRLIATNQELDSLDQLAPPTSDLALEEEAALRRLARKEALNRVKAALTIELAELQATRAAEVEEERRKATIKAEADVEAAKAIFIAQLWGAYQASEEFKASFTDLDKLKPNMHSRADNANNFCNHLLSLLQQLNAVKVVEHMDHRRRVVTRI